VSKDTKDFPSALGAPAEHPANPKIVGPSTDPLVVEEGTRKTVPIQDPPGPSPFKYVDDRGKEHDSAGDAMDATRKNAERKNDSD
jgi:hypothetical protein